MAGSSSGEQQRVDELTETPMRMVGSPPASVPEQQPPEQLAWLQQHQQLQQEREQRHQRLQEQQQGWQRRDEQKQKAQQQEEAQQRRRQQEQQLREQKQEWQRQRQQEQQLQHEQQQQRQQEQQRQREQEQEQKRRQQEQEQKRERQQEQEQERQRRQQERQEQQQRRQQQRELFRQLHVPLTGRLGISLASAAAGLWRFQLGPGIALILLVVLLYGPHLALSNRQTGGSLEALRAVNPAHHPVAYLLTLVSAQLVVLMAGAVGECHRAISEVELRVREVLLNTRLGALDVVGAAHMRRVFTYWGRYALHVLFGAPVLAWFLLLSICQVLPVAALNPVERQRALDMISFAHFAYSIAAISACGFPRVIVSLTHWVVASAFGVSRRRLVPHERFPERRLLDLRLKRSATAAANVQVDAHMVYDSIDALEWLVLCLPSCMSGVASSVLSCIRHPAAAVSQFCRWLPSGQAVLACVLGCVVVLHSVSLPWQHWLTYYTQLWYLHAPYLLAFVQLVTLSVLVSFCARTLQEPASSRPAAAQAAEPSNRNWVRVVQWVLWLMLLVNQFAVFACLHPGGYPPPSIAVPEFLDSKTLGIAVGAWQYWVVACYLAMHVPIATQWLEQVLRRVSGFVFGLAGRAGNPLPQLYSWRAHIRWCAEQALRPLQFLQGHLAALAACARARASARTRQAAPTASSSSSRAIKAQVHVDEHSDFSSRVQALKAEAHEEVTACTLCYEAPRTVGFQPCGHVICCDFCFKELKRRAGKKGPLECPVCKQVVRGHVAGLRL